MKLDEFIKMCASRDWEELKSFLQSNIKDLATKILVSAIIEAHHPDKNIALNYGLEECWGKRLSADPVPPMLSMMTSAVDLGDFAGAYCLAQNEDLNDLKAAGAIIAYVNKNKLQLAPYLNSGLVSKKDKDLISKIFSDLELSKAEKEAYFARHFANEAKAKIAFLEGREKINLELSRFFDLPQSAFRVSYSHSSTTNGIEFYASSSEGHISFNSSISNDTIKMLAKKLEDLGISANYYNMSYETGHNRSRGMRLIGKLHEVLQKITATDAPQSTQNTNTLK